MQSIQPKELGVFLSLIFSVSLLCLMIFETVSCYSVFSVQFLEIDSSKLLPFIVVVSGKFGSDTPIKCEHIGIHGVIVEETIFVYKFDGSGDSECESLRG